MVFVSAKQQTGEDGNIKMLNKSVLIWATLSLNHFNMHFPCLSLSRFSQLVLRLHLLILMNMHHQQRRSSCSDDPAGLNSNFVSLIYQWMVGCNSCGSGCRIGFPKTPFQRANCHCCCCTVTLCCYSCHATASCGQMFRVGIVQQLHDKKFN